MRKKVTGVPAQVPRRGGWARVAAVDCGGAGARGRPRAALAAAGNGRRGRAFPGRADAAVDAGGCVALEATLTVVETFGGAGAGSDRAAPRGGGRTCFAGGEGDASPPPPPPPPPPAAAGEGEGWGEDRGDPRPTFASAPAVFPFGDGGDGRRGGARTAYYSIACAIPPFVEWTVERRYRQFRELARRLPRASRVDAAAGDAGLDWAVDVPPLPPREWWWSTPAWNPNRFRIRFNASVPERIFGNSLSGRRRTTRSLQTERS